MKVVVAMTDYPTREYIIRETTYPDATKQEVIGELVRCKGCEHREFYGPYLFCERHGMSVDADYYCGDGIREDGGDGQI